ncbi:MAG: Wzz/FepE/Etk N-terminal domain-containing protein [Hyphomonadaceae bacterium]|nr:Wzz/FepE/Etk N-terminal domain-containing protein [Hyphomonadaceae bacterium]
MTDSADWGPRGVVQADAGYVPVRPRLSMSDFLVQLWRSKWTMILAALPVLAVGLLLALQMPTQFESRSSLYVTAGDEVRTAGASGLGIQEQVQGEAQILRTRLVAERTLSRFPFSRIFPDLMKAQERANRQAPSSQRDAIERVYFQQGVDAFRRSFSVEAAPGSNVIQLAVRHDDPGTAAELLNAAMAVYLQRRAELFGNRPVSEAGAERKRIEGDLLAAQDAIRAFLSTHSIRDFASERSTAQGLHAVISGELSASQARQKAVAAELARTRRQLGDTSAQQDLYIEDTGALRLRELESQRSEALATYTPESRRVQAIERQIADLRAAIEAGEGPAETVRRGPNPTYQSLEASRFALEAERDALAQQIAELTRQFEAVEEKLNRFTGLEPEWTALLRDRDLAEASLRALGTHGQQQGGSQDLPAPSADSIKITEPATLPLRGQSLKLPFAMLATFLAALAALIAGTLRVRSMRGFPTAGALQRTTHMPVLATVGRA